MAKYNDVREELLQHIRDGCTFKEACQYVGVSEGQFYEWKATKPDFAEAVKKARKDGRAKIIPELEKSLFKRALGYEYTETKTETFPDGNSRVTVTKKVMPPDVASLVFALCNLAPGDWRNKVEQKVEGDLKTTVKVEVDDKETMKEIQKLGE